MAASSSFPSSSASFSFPSSPRDASSACLEPSEGERRPRRRRRIMALGGESESSASSKALPETPPCEPGLAVLEGGDVAISNERDASTESSFEDVPSSVCAECVSSLRLRKRQRAEAAQSALQSVHATRVYRRPGCRVCRGKLFQPPKPVRRPARSLRELQLMLSSEAVPLPWILPSDREKVADETLVPVVRVGKGKRCAAWDSAEACRCTFRNPFDAALLPRTSRGRPLVSSLCERGAVSGDLGVVEIPAVGQPPPASSSSDSPSCSSLSSSSLPPLAASLSVPEETCCQCLGRALCFRDKVASDASVRRELREWIKKRRGPASTLHASDDSTASSGSELAPEDFNAESLIALQGACRPATEIETEVACLEFMRRPLRNIETSDLFACVLTAGASPVSALSELWKAGARRGDRSRACVSQPATMHASEAVDPEETSFFLKINPYLKECLFDRICSHAKERNRLAPSLASQLARLFPAEKPRPASTPLWTHPRERLGALLEKRLREEGKTEGLLTEEDPTQFQLKVQQQQRASSLARDERLFRKAKAAFPLACGLGENADGDDEDERTFAAIEERLSSMAMGIVPFDPDCEWRRAVAFKKRKETASPSLAKCSTPEEIASAVSEELPVRLSAKYRHSNLRVSEEPVVGEDADETAWFRVSQTGNRCGVVLATHAAREGSFFFEVQLERSVHFVSHANLLTDLRVGWATRSVSPAAPLGTTSDSVGFSVATNRASWGSLETLRLAKERLVSGDTLGCLLVRRRKAEAKLQESKTVALSSLQDVERLLHGFRSADVEAEVSLTRGNLGDSDGKRNEAEEQEGEEEGEAFAQFTLNGQMLPPCVFGGSRGYMKSEEYFPAVSLFGAGVSCLVNFGPSFRFPPNHAAFPRLSKLKLPLSAPRTFDVYGLLVSPHKLVFDRTRGVLRPQTLADSLQTSFQSTSDSTPATRQRGEGTGRRRSSKTSTKAKTSAARPRNSDDCSFSAKSRNREEGAEHKQDGKAGFVEAPPDLNSWRDLAIEGPLWKRRFMEAELAVRMSDAVRLKLRRLGKTKRRRARLLRSLHDAAFKSQMEMCRQVLEAAALKWGERSKRVGFNRLARRPWDRRYCLCSDDSDDNLAFTSESSEEEDASHPSENSKLAKSDEARPTTAHFVNFENPASVFFPFLLPSLNSLASSTKNSGSSAEGEETLSACRARRYANLFWSVVAPLDSQRRPLKASRFFANCQVDASRKKGCSLRTAFRRAAKRKTGGSSSSAERGSATPNPVSAIWQELFRVGDSSALDAPFRLEAEGDEEAPFVEEKKEASAARQTGHDCVSSTSAKSPPSERSVSSSSTQILASQSRAFPAQPLSRVLLQRLDLTSPRQLLEGLNCKFRVVCASLTGTGPSAATVHGLSCLYTVVVRLRNLQATAQAAEEEAAKDLACEFWMQQHCVALCGWTA